MNDVAKFLGLKMQEGVIKEALRQLNQALAYIAGAIEGNRESPSSEALLKIQHEIKQIGHLLDRLLWKIEGTKNECHVSDGHIYASDKDEYRCKICGEFYK